jgi:hypothetical protein
MKTRPKDATQWSVRAMAAAQKVNSATVQRIWEKHKLQPHRVESFKFSNDPQFARTVHDIVGLYMNPPGKALVLSVDEKSQIQALDRTRPILPLRPGLPERQTHDYQRHGTTTLFAALNVLEGTVIGECHSRHWHQEFLRFLDRIDQSLGAGVDIHLVRRPPSRMRRSKSAIGMATKLVGLWQSVETALKAAGVIHGPT